MPYTKMVLRSNSGVGKPMGWWGATWKEYDYERKRLMARAKKYQKLSNKTWWKWVEYDSGMTENGCQIAFCMHCSLFYHQSWGCYPCRTGGGNGSDDAEYLGLE